MTLDFIGACRKFIELDSTPSNGTLEIAQYASELCRRAGLVVELQSETLNGVEQANVIARPTRVRPDQELLLQTHLDTGEPGGYALWTKTGANPFNASIYSDSTAGDSIFGLGVASAKLDFLCKLRAIEALNGSAWRLPCVLVGTFGEELGMTGAIKLIRKKRIAAQMALVGEPTELSLISAGKGIAEVEIEIPFSVEEKEFREKHDLEDGTTTQSRIFIGKAAHSSVPQFGESAILKLFDYLTKLPNGLAVMQIEGGTSFNTVPAHAVLEIDMVGGLRDTIGQKISVIMAAISDVEKRFSAFPDSDFDPPVPTLNIGMIRTYEDHVKLRGCCRLPPSVNNEVYEQWMDKLRSSCQSVGGSFRITDYTQPFRTPINSDLLKVCDTEAQALGLNRKSRATSVSNEANVFSRFGIECVVFGPGRGVGNSHAPNENVKVNELHQASHFYQSVLERICL